MSWVPAREAAFLNLHREYVVAIDFGQALRPNAKHVDSPAPAYGQLGPRTLLPAVLTKTS